MAPTEARIAVTGYVVLGDAEDLTHLDTGPDRITGSVMRLLQHPEEALGCGLHAPVHERAAAIPPVTADGGAAVELDEVALSDAGVALGVDPYPHPCADGRQDPLVRVVLVAGISHRGQRDAHNVALAHVRRVHAGFEVLDRKAHPRLRELRRPPEPFDFERVLYASQPVHVVREVHPLGIRRLLRKAPVRIEQHVAEIRSYPGAEQAPVSQQPAQDPILLVLVELCGAWRLRFAAPEGFLYRLGVPDLRPQHVGPDVPDARDPPRRLRLEVPNHHAYLGVLIGRYDGEHGALHAPPLRQEVALEARGVEYVRRGVGDISVQPAGLKSPPDGRKDLFVNDAHSSLQPAFPPRL